MKEKILVPLDGSQVGEAALPHVEAMLSKFVPELKVEVTLIQVISSLSHYVISGEATVRIPYTQEEIEQIKKMATNYLRKASEALRKKGAVAKFKVVVGDAAEEIIRAADEIDADIIAMATHGRSGLTRWAFGSVADKVLRGGEKPVLVVRPPKEKGRDV